VWRSLRDAITAVAMSALSGAAWYALSAPPFHQLHFPKISLTLARQKARRCLLRRRPDLTTINSSPSSCRRVAGPSVVVWQPASLGSTPFFITAAGDTGNTVHGGSQRCAAISRSASRPRAGGARPIIRAHGLQVQFLARQTRALNHSEQCPCDASRTSRVPHRELRSGLLDRKAVDISPYSAYDIQTDRVLVLDVAAHRYPHFWVETAKLGAR
jgi:hypothetical protein